MKRIFSLALVFGLVLTGLGTGIEPQNQPQTGTATFTGTSTTTQTITFPINYTIAPVITLQPQTTNGVPYTISAITVSNFVLVATGYATTNDVVNWTAYLGYPRIAQGVVITVANTVTNVSFPFPYAYVPVVTTSDTTSNLVYHGGVLNVTTTNFSMSSNLASTNQWSAMGQAFAPGTSPVTF